MAAGVLILISTGVAGLILAVPEAIPRVAIRTAPYIIYLKYRILDIIPAFFWCATSSRPCYQFEAGFGPQFTGVSNGFPSIIACKLS